ncbi:MAG TPA: PIN domain-containing protein [Candidatus Lustribacter sp.]|nr:PIN domain-containing protein [Candidatus Lustribacter sp.]
MVESLLAQPGTVVAEPTIRHTSILRGLLEQAGTAGNLTTDAHVAAIAIEHGATIATFDRDSDPAGHLGRWAA